MCIIRDSTLRNCSDQISAHSSQARIPLVPRALRSQKLPGFCLEDPRSSQTCILAEELLGRLRYSTQELSGHESSSGVTHVPRYCAYGKLRAAGDSESRDLRGFRIIRVSYTAWVPSGFARPAAAGELCRRRSTCLSRWSRGGVVAELNHKKFNSAAQMIWSLRGVDGSGSSAHTQHLSHTSPPPQPPSCHASSSSRPPWPEGRLAL